jgi:hypothetical protein
MKYAYDLKTGRIVASYSYDIADVDFTALGQGLVESEHDLDPELWGVKDGKLVEISELYTPEEKAAKLQKRYTDLIQRILDAEAQKLGYDNCNSVCTYVDTGVAKFDAEGVAFRKWRSAVWALGYELLAEVQAGTRPVPTEEELIDLLPKLEIVYES